MQHIHTYMIDFFIYFITIYYYSLYIVTNELEEYLLTNNTVIYEYNYFISYEECKIDLDFLLSNIYTYIYI
jgi:hypothetical protein